jgi:CBF1 interacting corepressor
MGGGLTFLSKKRFNPANFSNQKRVWEAQQQKIEEEKRLKEREDQLKKERGETEMAIIMGGKAGGAKQSLRFMYAPPPGVTAGGEVGRSDSHTFCMNQGGNNVTFSGSGKSDEKDDFYSPSAGDDPATAQFRLMLAGATSAADNNTYPYDNRDHNNNGEIPIHVEQPSTDVSVAVKAPVVIDNRTKLEKEVGKLASSRTIPTLSEQMERFPQLKHAPIAVKRTGSKVADAAGNTVSVDNVMSVHFKPMGATLRNVKCFKCGIWGHSVGDRECKLSGWNPFDGSRPSFLKNSNDTESSCNRQPLEVSDQQKVVVEGELKEKSRKLEIQRKRHYDSEDSQSQVSSSQESSIEHHKKRRRERPRKSKHSKRHGNAIDADSHSSATSSSSSLHRHRYKKKRKNNRMIRQSKHEKRKEKKQR